MDLQTIFTAVLNMTVTASIVIGCVLAARLALRSAPKAFCCALWLVVLFRLLCPVSVSGPVSVLNLVQAPEPEGNVGLVEYVQSPVQAPLETIHADPGQAQPGGSAGPVRTETPIDWHLICSRIWAVGIAVLTVYGILSYVNLKRKLRNALPAGKGIRETDGIRSPFVLGFLRPVIYLPAALKPEEREHILLHERCHVRWGDPLAKGLFFLACCIHWFNPLVWIAFVLYTRDMEMRCDESVLRKLGDGVRSDYAQSLLNLAVGGRMAPAPLAFGEGDTGKRIRHVLKWQRCSIRYLIPAAALCAVVLVLTACNPAAEAESPFGHSYRAESTYASAHIEHAYNTNYTLTSDMGMIIRGEKTEQVGFFREVSADDDTLGDFSEDFRRNIRRCWHIEDTGWWLLELKSGKLQLHNLEQSVTHILARTDLLGVTIRQPGMESYLEPTWHRSEEWDWPIEELPVTPVDGEAEIILTADTDADTILVTERYFEAVPEGLYGGVSVADHFLERNADGQFVLEVSRRGSVGDDNAIYQVTVGEEHYMFRLSFPMVPGETSVSYEPARTVEWTDAGAYITLQLPESWEYTLAASEPAGYAGGITFWPRGREEGKLRLEYHPNGFGVCGTGLEVSEVLLAGRKGEMGFYDGRELWSYIAFGDFAVTGDNHGAWWAEYGDAAMAILNSMEFEETE